MSGCHIRGQMSVTNCIRYQREVREPFELGSDARSHTELLMSLTCVTSWRQNSAWFAATMCMCAALQWYKCVHHVFSWLYCHLALLIAVFETIGPLSFYIRSVISASRNWLLWASNYPVNNSSVGLQQIAKLIIHMALAVLARAEFRDFLTT